jgi:antitoxin component HigA of HigAB toxin-antitoxin module
LKEKLEFANIIAMKTIAEEIRSFMEATGASQAALSAISGVPASTICNLLKGKRKHLLGPNQDAIRAAMRDMAIGNRISRPGAPEPRP